jgi:hypothetical protein
MDKNLDAKKINSFIFIAKKNILIFVTLDWACQTQITLSAAKVFNKIYIVISSIISSYNFFLHYE